MTGPACDFCNDLCSTWRYPTRDFGTVVMGASRALMRVDLSGGWWACDRCQPYVEDRRYDELASYNYAKWLAERLVPPSRQVARSIRAANRETYRAFERNRSGEPTRYVRRQAAS